MTPPKKTSGEDEPGKKKAPKKLKVRTHTPRPDELSKECFEFIAAVDGYKRSHMRSFLEDREVLQILVDLGYRRSGGKAKVSKADLADYGECRQRYRVEEGRLFPTWSEVFELLMGMGYERDGQDTAA